MSVLWAVEQEEGEDVLQEFVNKSLLFRDCNQRPYLYYLHDLQLDFLTELNRTRLSVGLTLSLTLTHFLSLCLSLSLSLSFSVSISVSLSRTLFHSLSLCLSLSIFLL